MIQMYASPPSAVYANLGNNFAPLAADGDLVDGEHGALLRILRDVEGTVPL